MKSVKHSVSTVALPLFSALLFVAVMQLWACGNHQHADNQTAAQPATESSAVSPQPAPASEGSGATPQVQPASDKPAAGQTATIGKTKPASGGDYAVLANKIDYICEMEVVLGDSDTCHYKGKAYGFCSEHCKEKFLESPEKYLAKK